MCCIDGLWRQWKHLCVSDWLSVIEHKMCTCQPAMEPGIIEVLSVTKLQISFMNFGPVGGRHVGIKPSCIHPQKW